MLPYNIHIISKGETIQRITDLVNIKGHGILHYERSKKDFMNEAPFKLIVEESPVFNNAGDFRLRCYMNLQTRFSESVYLEYSIMLDNI